MQQVNWHAPARLIERTDDGSDMQFDFRTLEAGALHILVALVAGLDPPTRARMLIDCGSAGMLTVSEIMALAARDDFPMNGPKC